MSKYRKRKVITIKNPDCKDPNIMLQNYKGLWQGSELHIFRLVWDRLLISHLFVRPISHLPPIESTAHLPPVLPPTYF